MPSPRVIVLCPLAIEAAAASAAVGGRASVVTAGPGERIADAVRAAASDPGGKPSLIILAGLCGGLSATPRAPRIGAVLSMTTKQWLAPVIGPDVADDASKPSLPAAAPNPLAPPSRPRRLYDRPELDQPSDGRVTLLGSDAVIHSPRAKAALGERTGADLVDTESHHFAPACEAAGLRWAIVRAVSDGPGDALPRGVETWVDSQGRTKPNAVAMACLTRPWIIPSLMRLRTNTASALSAMASRLIAVLDAERSPTTAAPSRPASSTVGASR